MVFRSVGYKFAGGGKEAYITYPLENQFHRATGLPVKGKTMKQNYAYIGVYLCDLG